jgi:hypothetical protein
VVVALIAAKLLIEVSTVRHLAGHGEGEGGRRARLLTGELRPTALVRLSTGAIGAVVLPVAVLASADGSHGWVVAIAATLGLLLLVGSELAERLLFFATASRPR